MNTIKTAIRENNIALANYSNEVIEHISTLSTAINEKSDKDSLLTVAEIQSLTDLANNKLG